VSDPSSPCEPEPTPEPTLCPEGPAPCEPEPTPEPTLCPEVGESCEPSTGPEPIDDCAVDPKSELQTQC
jgi:hypothetical protein